MRDILTEATIDSETRAQLMAALIHRACQALHRAGSRSGRVRHPAV